MGLNSFKNNEPKTNDDEVARLMCSVPGCPKRWSVSFGSAPKCSEHQWMTSKRPSEKTIDAWYSKEDF